MQKSYSLLATSILLGFATTSANAISLYDYQEAKVSYTDAKVNAAFNYQTNKNNTVNELEGIGQKDSYNLDLDLNYSKVFSIPIRDFEFGANVSGNTNRTSAGVKTNNYGGDASARVFNYFKPNSKGAFVYGGASVADQKDAPKYYADAFAGVGYGRIVDATPMSKAILLVRELRKQGKLAGDLSVSDYQSLARVIAKEPEYEARTNFATSNYYEAWVSDMAAIVNASGKANGNLDSAAVVRVYDSLANGTFIKRRIGTRVRAGVGSIVKNYDGEKGKPAVEVVAEYHRPINNAWQFNNVTTLTGTVDSDNNGHNLKNRVSLDKQINVKSTWENYWQINRNKSNSSSATTNNELGSTYNYALGNKFVVFGKAVATKDTGTKTDLVLKAGISYKLR